jgi:hypothetical protein
VETTMLAKYRGIKTFSEDKKPYKLIKELTSDPSIRIVPSDKNLGLVMMFESHYQTMVNEHLDNPINYTMIEEPSMTKQLITQLLTLNQEAVDLFSTRIKTLHLYLNLAIHDNQIPKFKILPKLHKTPVKGRPIAGAHSWITTRLSKLTSFILKPLVQSIPTILTNSGELINALEGMSLDETDMLVTMDITALYPNMKRSLTIQLPSELPDTHGLNKPIRKWLTKVITFILDCSVIQHDHRYMLQREGIPMGTNCAVELANLYVMYYIERHISELPLHIHVKHWYRYIDDIFFIWKGNTDDLIRFQNQLNQICDGINFTTDYNNIKIPFLDLWVTRQHNKIGFECFQKPLNRYLYLTYHSNHPKSTKRGFIKGELLRYARNCTRRDDFTKMKTLFRHRLMMRGYPKSFIDETFNTITHSMRLQQPQADQRSIVPFVIKFHPTLERLNLTRTLMQSWHLLKFNSRLKPIVAFSKSPNILELIEKSQLQARNKPQSSHPKIDNSSF